MRRCRISTGLPIKALHGNLSRSIRHMLPSTLIRSVMTVTNHEPLSSSILISWSMSSLLLSSRMTKSTPGGESLAIDRASGPATDATSVVPVTTAVPITPQASCLFSSDSRPGPRSSTTFNPLRTCGSMSSTRKHANRRAPPEKCEPTCSTTQTRPGAARFAQFSVS